MVSVHTLQELAHHLEEEIRTTFLGLLLWGSTQLARSGRELVHYSYSILSWLWADSLIPLSKSD